MSKSDSSSAEQASMDPNITLGLLHAIHENSAITQRSVAKELGIALGLTNAYLKRCVKKGLIKVCQAPSNRYAYYLTPKGFIEKGRLTAQYLSISFDFFRNARRQCSDLLSQCSDKGWKNVVLAGVGDLGEVVTLCVLDHPVTIVGILDENTDADVFVGLPVLRHLEDCGAADAIIITNMTAPQETYDRLVDHFPPERILAPELVRVIRHGGEKK